MIDSEIDLAWYYQSAAADAGLRSPLGGQLEMLRNGLMGGGRRVVLSDDLAVERFDEGARLLRVSRRLGQLSVRHRRLLEAQYSVEKPGSGRVALGVALETDEALSAYRAALEASPKRQVTLAGWLLWLQSQKSEAAQALYDQILIAARGDLDEALLAYDQAGKEAA